MMGAACAMGLAFADPSVATATGADPVWARAVAGNGDFSIETICTSAEVAALADLPNALKITPVPQSRVMCMKDGLLFMAASWEASDLPRDGGSLFDQLWAGIEGRKDAEGGPVKTVINGRRAITNREFTDGVLAQTGFIEISPKRVLFMVAGGQDSRVSAEAQGQAIDRFFGSAKVTAK